MEILYAIVNTIVVPLLGYIVLLRFKKMINEQLEQRKKNK